MVIDIPKELLQIILQYLDIKDMLNFITSSKKIYNVFYNYIFFFIYLKNTNKSIWKLLYYSRNNKELVLLINHVIRLKQTNYFLEYSKKTIYTTYNFIINYNIDIIRYLLNLNYYTEELVYCFIKYKKYDLSYFIIKNMKSRVYKHFICFILINKEINNGNYNANIIDIWFFLYKNLDYFEKNIYFSTKTTNKNKIQF